MLQNFSQLKINY